MAMAKRVIMDCRVVSVNGSEKVILPQGTRFRIKEKGKRVGWLIGHQTDDFYFPPVSIETANGEYRQHFISGENARGEKRRYLLETRARRVAVHNSGTPEETVDFAIDLKARPIGRRFDFLRGERRVEEVTPEVDEQLKAYGYASKF